MKYFSWEQISRLLGEHLSKSYFNLFNIDGTSWAIVSDVGTDLYDT